MRILIADDEKEIRELLQLHLSTHDFNVETVEDGAQAIDALFNNHYDLAIIDIMMPNKDGLEVIEEVRNQGIAIPILITSAKNQDSDRIKGLMTGADDYVTKPFNIVEVILRVKSLLRRQTSPIAPTQDGIIEIDPLIINKNSHEVITTEGENIQLTAIEFNILYLLASHPNQVFSADEIFKEVWNQDTVVSAKTVMVHVSHLRDKIGEATNGNKVIQTVWGVGYKIEA